MRFSFIFPLLLTVAAFVLSLLVLLAGKNTSFLQSIYILKINTANITVSRSLITSAASDFGVTLPSSVTSILDSLPQSEVSRVTQTTAKELGLRDFYTAHVMTYCEGFDFYKTNSSATSTSSSNSSNIEQDVTYCSNPKAMFAFNPISIFSTELIPGVTISDLGIPDQVKADAKAVGVAYKVMLITYIIGIALSGILVILTILSGWIDSRLAAFFIGLFSFLSLAALVIASTIGTIIAVKLRDVFNQYMVPNLNVSAQSSAGYLGMTWAAVGSLLLVWIYWSGMCCCGSRRDRTRATKWSTRRHNRKRVSAEEGLIGDGRPAMKEAPRYS